MRILLVKTSSLGDVVHNLPVAADLARQFPGAEIDWCVEEAFADIPRLSPHVHETIPIAIRRWRKNLLDPATWGEIGALRQRLKQGRYDAVLDTQGLLKSALVALQAPGQHLGHAADSAREPLAARFYAQGFSIPRNLHAVERNRRLAAAAFDYSLDTALDYGIRAPAYDASWLPTTPFAVLLTATSRDDKLWPEENWMALGKSLAARSLRCVLPAGNLKERERAERIAANIPGAVAAPALRICDLAAILGRASLAVGVDTGLVHLAAALANPSTPTIALYTTTDPALTGIVGSGFARNLGGIDRPPSADEVLACVAEALP